MGRFCAKKRRQYVKFLYKYAEETDGGIFSGKDRTSVVKFRERRNFCRF